MIATGRLFCARFFPRSHEAKECECFCRCGNPKRLDERECDTCLLKTRKFSRVRQYYFEQAV